MDDGERAEDATLALAVEATAQTPEALARRIALLEELVLKLANAVFWSGNRRAWSDMRSAVEAIHARRELRKKAGAP